MSAQDEVAVEREGHVATIEIRRPPHNFFDVHLIRAIADACDELAADTQCRAVVLASQGTAFCAGANFANAAPGTIGTAGRDPMVMYGQGLRLFSFPKPIIAAVHGPAIGGGLGLALVADFRVSCPEARFSANFARLGLHSGFGIIVTLPRAVGAQHAQQLLLTGRRIGGDEALRIGLADELVPREQVRERAQALAREIAGCAPLAVEAMRASLRMGLAEQVRAACEHEAREQVRLGTTADYREGVDAMAARREPVFTRS